ncbi:MAG: type II/IV secretion system ATPase subunit [Candidatus Aenigmarchaeota archaeon]|nr:type II/IV secretion system ATPase subunit [Candidatus Aenigmarchaeota archaeon]
MGFRISLKPPSFPKIRVKTAAPVAAPTGFIGTPLPAQETHARRGTPSAEFRALIDNGINVPVIAMQKQEEEKAQESDVKELTYPLKFPGFAAGVPIYVRIEYDPAAKEMVYRVIEPEVNENEKKMIQNIKDYIQEKVDINFSEVRNTNVEGYIDKSVRRALSYFGYALSEEKKAVLKYYVFRDFIGMERVEPLLADKNIEDISCDGENISIYVYHRNPKLGSIRTNIKFDNATELDSFVNRLSERCGKTISISHPLLDGTLPDGSRVQATLGSDIARRGSNFTIRMFTDKPLTPVDLINYGTCDTTMLAYAWFLLEYGKSFLLSGGTATGKTSFLNVLSLFINPQMKIVSIEDTAELRLPHSHWVPEVARVSVDETGVQVDMFSLLKESLRQRPDYIIVGEVRGKEAYVLFQQMAVGHPGLSTVHAEDFNKLVDRLTSEPIGLPPYLLQNLDVIIFIKRVKKGRKYIRRVSSLVEVIGFDEDSKAPVMDEIMTWDARNDKYAVGNKSVLLRKISDSIGLTPDEIRREIEKRGMIINWMLERGIKDYREVGAVIDAFYTSPEGLLAKIGGDA